MTLTPTPIPFDTWLERNPDLVASAEACPECHGKKGETCPECHGYCVNIHDAFPLPCRHCDGAGFIKCFQCQGDGTALYTLYLELACVERYFIDARKPKAATQ